MNSTVLKRPVVPATRQSPIKAVIYACTSDPDARAVQINRLTEWCRQAGWVVGHTIAESGMAPSKRARKQILRGVREGAIDGIVVTRLSQFFIEVPEAIGFLSNVLKCGVRVASLDDRIILGQKADGIVMADVNSPICLLATASLIGEGVDIPRLDTLVLAMPISFKGRMVQYAGRLHRQYPGKKDVVIYDYLDTCSGLTVSMYRKRVQAYRNMGYQIHAPEHSVIANRGTQASLFGSTIDVS